MEAIDGLQLAVMVLDVHGEVAANTRVLCASGGAAIAAALQGVSKDGENCTDFASCKALLDAGTDFNYEGQAGPVEFADNGDPSIATMGVYEYEANDRYVPRLDEFVTGTVPTS